MLCIITMVAGWVLLFQESVVTTIGCQVGWLARRFYQLKCT